MKKLSLQWRITLMTVLLIGITCVSMNLLICCSGRHYMDSIGTYISETDNTDKTNRNSLFPTGQNRISSLLLSLTERRRLLLQPTGTLRRR